MGIDTNGRIKGFKKPDEIFNFIKQKWDKNATHNIKKSVYCPISECEFAYKMNEHSEDDKYWYIISGFIYFKFQNENRMLFYYYTNLNSFENLEYYSKLGLEKMVQSETTSISLGCWGSSVEIIKEILLHFGGGWIDNNDCDGKEYYQIIPTTEN